MKKLLALCLFLAFACGMAFAEDGDEEDGEFEDHDFMYVQLGASVMYKQPFNDPFSIFNFRGGVTGDLLIPFGKVEIGVEIGAYVMEVDDDWYGYFFILEMPLDALVRINLSRNRSLALEVRGGGWFIVDSTGYFTEVGYNGGARLVAKWFYIGGDYIYSPFWISSWSAEAGIKFSF